MTTSCKIMHIVCCNCETDTGKFLATKENNNIENTTTNQHIVIASRVIETVFQLNKKKY